MIRIWLFLATSVAFANPLCERVLHVLGNDLERSYALYPSPYDPARIKAAAIVDTIIAARAHKPNRDPNPYRRYVITVKDNRTLHFRQEFAEGFQPEGVISDSAFVLTLPNGTQRTVWEVLTPDEKIALVNNLTARFNNGIYDREAMWKKLGDAATLQALITARVHYTSKIWDQLYEATGLDEHEINVWVGFSPTRLLRAANKRERSGTCRHANPPVVAILGELGAKNEELRLIITGFYDEKGSRVTGHIHFELRDPRDPEGKKWIPFDATPTAEEITDADREVLKLEARTDRIVTDFLIPKPIPGINR